jgi:hypothetical protein
MAKLTFDDAKASFYHGCHYPCCAHPVRVYHYSFPPSGCAIPRRRGQRRASAQSGLVDAQAHAHRHAPVSSDGPVGLTTPATLARPNRSRRSVSQAACRERPAARKRTCGNGPVGAKSCGRLRRSQRPMKHTLGRSALTTCRPRSTGVASSSRSAARPHLRRTFSLIDDAAPYTPSSRLTARSTRGPSS